MENKTSLNDLRKQIDSVNDEIYDLLKKRISIVGQVGAYKAQNLSHIKTIMKPTRERDMVLNIYKKAIDDGYPDKIALAIANIWRGMITLSINHEEHSSIAVMLSDVHAYYLAREHFGFFTDIIEAETIEVVFQSLVRDKVKIAVFDISYEEEVVALINNYNANAENTEKIVNFVDLPFFDVSLKDSTPKAFALAKVFE